MGPASGTPGVSWKRFVGFKYEHIHDWLTNPLSSLSLVRTHSLSHTLSLSFSLSLFGCKTLVTVYFHQLLIKLPNDLLISLSATLCCANEPERTGIWTGDSGITIRHNGHIALMQLWDRIPKTKTDVWSPIFYINCSKSSYSSFYLKIVPHKTTIYCTERENKEKGFGP